MAKEQSHQKNKIMKKDKRKKPPIGLMPKSIHDEKRFESISKAMDRYLKAGKIIPVEWVYEYEELKVIINKSN